jgi:hypothetical protein
LKTLFYGDEKTLPESFTGLGPRFSSRNPAVAASADNVLHGGGSGSSNTSVWLIIWGEPTINGIYPKGQKGGLRTEYLGRVTIENIDGSGGRMQAYRGHYRWKCGLSVRDWRYAVRIANIDVTTLTKDASAGADLIDLMVRALEIVPTVPKGRPAFYMNRSVRAFLRRQMKNEKNVRLSLDEAPGKHVLLFDEVPVRRSDVLLNTEPLVP